MKENKDLTRIYYILLLKGFLKFITQTKDQKLALQFLCGVLEGDGCLNAKKRGHIQITTNEQDSKILLQFLRLTNLNYKEYKEKKSGKYYIRIGELGLFDNLEYLKNILFKHYPKRRKILIKRLCNTPSSSFITKEKEKISAWILKRFREKGILNIENKLTKKGKKISQTIKELKKELEETEQEELEKQQKKESIMTMRASEAVLKEDWDNECDEQWNKCRKRFLVE